MDVIDDVDLLVTMVASGIVDAYEIAQEEHALPVPYPVNLQRALDRLTVFAMARGERPPWGVAELLRWCARPLAEHFPIADGELGDEVFLEDGVPTREAREWALVARNAEAERIERRVIAKVKGAARSAGRQDVYVAFRRLVIDEPVLSVLEFNRRLLDPVLSLVAAAIHESYTAAGPEFLRSDVAIACDDCGHLLRWEGDTAQCRNDRCSRTGPPKEGTRFDASESVMHLHEGIRVSVSAPGVAEMRLWRKFTGPKYRAAGLAVHLWPAFDAYDLGLVFPDRTVWAIDVKDWASPVRLAREVSPIPREPAVPEGSMWTQAFLVPSDDCRRPVPDYIKTLKQRLKQRTTAVNFQAVTESTLARRVDAKLFGGNGHA